MVRDTQANADRPKSSTALNPGDEAKSGTPGTGENVCPVCHGTKTVANATGANAPCPNCGGTGVVIEGIGGA